MMAPAGGKSTWVWVRRVGTGGVHAYLEQLEDGGNIIGCVEAFVGGGLYYGYAGGGKIEAQTAEDARRKVEVLALMSSYGDRVGWGRA